MLIVTILIFLNNVNSVTVLKNLGTVYLYSNELYQADLYQYFNGSFINFTLISKNSDQGLIKNHWNLSSMSSHANNAPNDSLIISTFAKSSICYAISVQGLNLNLFLISITSGNGEFLFHFQVESNLKSAKIIQAIVHEEFIFVVVNGQEEIQGLDLNVNEIYFTSFISYPRKIPIWDLKFVKNLKMKLVTLSKVYFWGSLYGRDSVFVCYFDLFDLVVHQQITQYFEYGSNKTIDLDILDLGIYLDALIVLQRGVGIIAYLDSNLGYFENHYIGLRSYGQPISLSQYNNQLTSLMFFGVVMDSGIIIVEFRTYRIKFLIKEIIESNVQLQVFAPYVFIFHDNQLDIYYFLGFSFYTLHKIPFSTNESTVSVIQSLYGYSIVKLNNTKIEFLSLNFTMSLLEVTGKSNSSVTVAAEDEESCVSSEINVRIIEHLDEAYMIYNYRESFISSNDIYFDSLKSSGAFNVLSTVSGWNLSVDLIKGGNELIKYNFTESLAYSVYSELNITQEYSAGFYYYSLYLMNKHGVFCNGTLIINKTEPLNLTGGELFVSVLYPGLVVTYRIDSQEISSLSINSNCSSVFKYDELYTVCADNEKFLLIDQEDLYYRAYYYIYITNNEKVIDISVERDHLLEIEYIYLLTAQNLYFYILTSKSLTLVTILSETGKFILSSDPFVFVVGSSIKVYSLMLDTFFRTIPLPAPPSSISNNFLVIYAQIGDFIYLINGASPVIQSLVALIPAPNCQVYSSFNYILSLCGHSGFLYTDNCGDICYKTAHVNFYLENASDIDEGIILLNVSANVNSLKSTLDYHVLYELYTYSFFLSFNDSELSKTSYYYNYNKEVTWEMTNKFEGFDIECQLLINDSIITDPSFPLQLRPRILNQAYLDEPEYIFIDHDVIPGINNILVLCQDSIILLKYSFPNIDAIPSDLNISKAFPKSMYTLDDGNCYGINYISSKKNLALFVLNCNQTLNHEYYYRSNDTSFTINSFFLAFIEFDTLKLEFSNVYYLGFNHTIEWIQVVTSSSSCFLVLCIDFIDKEAIFFSTNNNLIVYSFVWQEKFHGSHLITINFARLNIERLQVLSADGVYLAAPGCTNQGTIYLYISDLFYGLRVVKVENKKAVLQSSINYYNEYLLSIAVCGNSVFCLSNLTYIDEYFFSKSHNLSFYGTIPPSLNYTLLGFTSYFSCSTYYRPHYLATYFISNTSDYYQLRLIDLESQSFASYFKFIDLPINGSVQYKGKSRFINESTFTVLGVNNGQLSTYSLLGTELIIESMTKSEYDSLIKKYKTSVFEVSLMYSNKYLAKNSSKFIIGRIGYGDKSSSSRSSVNTWWIWVIGSIVLFSVTISAIFIYKRVINRKHRQEKIFKTIGSITELTQKGRLVLLINPEDTFNSY